MSHWEWLGVPGWLAGVVGAMAVASLWASAWRKRRARLIEVSFLALWVSTRDETATQRLRRGSLALWLTAIGVMLSLLAALVPWPRPTLTSGKQVLLLVDEWALQTPDSAHAARTAIRKMVANLSIADRIALWSFDETPRQWMGWQRDRAALESILEQLAPRTHSARTSVANLPRRNVKRALAEATPELPAGGYVVLVGPKGYSAQANHEGHVRWLEAGSNASNVAVESLSFQRRGPSTEAALHVHNLNNHVCKAAIDVTDARGERLWHTDLELAPKARTGLAMALPVTNTKLLRAHISSPCDEVPEDNIIALAAAAALPKRVRLFGKPSAFIVQALRALPHPVVIADHTHERFPPRDADLQDNDLVIFNDMAGPPLPPQGHFVYFATTAAASPWPATAVAAANKRSVLPNGSSLWRDVSLTDVSWRRLLKLQPPADAVALASTNGRVVAAARSYPGFSQTAFGFGPQASDLPWHAGFPLLLDNLLTSASVANASAFGARDLVEPGDATPAMAWHAASEGIQFGTNVSRWAAGLAWLCAAVLFLGLQQGVGALAAHRRWRWWWRSLVLVSLLLAVWAPHQPTPNVQSVPAPKSPTDPAPPLMLKALVGPTMVAPNERFEVRVPLAATSPGVATLQIEQDAAAAVEVTGALATADGWRVQVLPGTTWVTATLSAPAKKAQTQIVARLVPTQPTAWMAGPHNEAKLIIPYKPAPRVLLLSEDPQADALGRVLQTQGFDVTAVTPARAPSPQGWAAIVINNAPLATLPRGWTVAAASAINDGCGLLVAAGGNLSFNAAWEQTPLQALLPALIEEQAQRPVADLATVLVVDRSGSMSGTKLALTLEAIKATTNAMRPSDLISVVAFDSRVETLVPLQIAANKPRIWAQMEKLSAGGGTNLWPAMREAYQTLLGAPASRKHMVVLSDGHTPSAGMQELIGDLSGANITLSTVALGSGADAGFLRRLADQGGGRSHITDDPARVPRIFANEIAAVSAMPQPKTLLKVKSVRTSARTSGINWTQAPGLRDVAHLRSRPGSQTLLSLPGGEPVLVGAHAGAGQVWLWAADASGPWASAWPAWQGFAPFWSQLVRSLSDARTGDIQPIIVSQSGVAKVVLKTPPGPNASSAIGKTGRLVIRGGENNTSVALWETAPGTYEAQLPLRPPGLQRHEPAAAALEAQFDELPNAGLGHTSWPGLPLEKPVATALPAEATAPPYRSWGPWFAALAALLFVAEIPRRRATFRASKTETSGRGAVW
ncbi:MAG: VWA domain-containing protein [Deltaproteobacteria bacterium]|nr:VWA domain-containing protein [Deltaproteobacteria bacterium]